MLQKHSYLNLVLGIIYLLVYLRNGTLSSTVGILMIIVFNWLYLRSFQLEDYRWKIWHYLTAAWSLYFMTITLYSSLQILMANIEYGFITNDTLVFLIFSMVFGIAVVLHLALYFKENLRYRNI